MRALGEFPPTEQTMHYGMTNLPNARFTPGAVGALDGVGGTLGPEHAGALSLVYGGFAEPDRAQHGYRRFIDAQCGLLEAPGFIRWIWFSDGPHGYALGLWRSPEDAVAFARGALHQELVREQREQGNEYSQFAGIWAAHTVGRRNYYCPDCGAITNAPATVCSGCGEALDDGFTAG